MKSKTSLNCLFALLLFAPLVFSSPGDLYESDSGSGNIFKFTPNGSKTVFASGLDQPGGLTFDRSGNLFVADHDGNIYKFLPDGTRSTFAAGLDNPAAVAFDRLGNLFVADLCGGDVGCGTLYKFSATGTRSVFASGFNFIALAFDRLGNLTAANNNGQIVKFASNGTQTLFANSGGQITSLAFDGAGNLFAADFFSGRILEFGPTGSPEVLFDSSVSPYALAFERSGTLFVAASNGSIFKFTAAGERSSFATGLSQPSSLAFEPTVETLRNISARGFVSTGDDVLIGGFIVGGSAVAQSGVVIRAIGPSLAAGGIQNSLADPMLELRDVSGTLIASNDNWQDTQAAQIRASGLAPKSVKESAIVATLPAGAFTAIVRGVGNTTGNALVEIYSVNP